MSDLGNRADALRLQCKPCGWVPPGSMKQEGMLLHFQVDHDSGEIVLEMVAACTCGEAMTVTSSSRISVSRVQDSLLCGVCGNTGYVRRKP